MKKPDICEVCEEAFEFGGWSIRHGEGICDNCGALYILKGEDAPICVLDDEAIEIAKEYYEETDEKTVWGQNDGVTDKESEAFEQWILENHPDFLD